MVAEEVYCLIAPDGVSIFYDFFIVFYLLSSSRRLHRLSANLAALFPLVASQAWLRSDVLEPQPGYKFITAGESRMFLALGVQDWYPAVPSASLHRLGFM